MQGFGALGSVKTGLEGQILQAALLYSKVSDS